MRVYTDVLHVTTLCRAIYLIMCKYQFSYYIIIIIIVTIHGRKRANSTLNEKKKTVGYPTRTKVYN